jgi:hypothetical protein
VGGAAAVVDGIVGERELVKGVMRYAPPDEEDVPRLLVVDEAAVGVSPHHRGDGHGVLAGGVCEGFVLTTNKNAPHA